MRSTPRLAGDVVLPGEETWDLCCQAWNLAAVLSGLQFRLIVLVSVGVLTGLHVISLESRVSSRRRCSCSGSASGSRTAEARLPG